jgi:hypothetical protein
MASSARSKTPSRKIRKLRKPTISPRRRNPAPQLTSPAEPGAQKLARRSSGQLQPPSRRDQKSMSLILEKLHPELLGDLSYHFLSRAMSLTGEHLEAAVPSALSFQEQMQPKDGLERLALTQALLAHARAAWLTKLLTSQMSAQSLAIISEACERASGTFGRLMRAIAEYRRPPSSSATVSIGQANLAHQQVVQNIQKQELQGKNDDERTKITTKGAAVTAEVLSADAEGAGVAADLHPTNAPMEEEHRTSNAGRKSPSQDKRTKTRRALRRSRRPQATDEDNDSKTVRSRGGPRRTMKIGASPCRRS